MPPWIIKTSLRKDEQAHVISRHVERRALLICPTTTSTASGDDIYGLEPGLKNVERKFTMQIDPRIQKTKECLRECSGQPQVSLVKKPILPLPDLLASSWEKCCSQCTAKILEIEGNSAGQSDLDDYRTRNLRLSAKFSCS